MGVTMYSDKYNIVHHLFQDIIKDTAEEILESECNKAIKNFKI